MTGRRKVTALTIDKAQIVYRCPHRKCGQYHYHHNEGELHNRLEYRCSHCELVKEELDIDINDRTMRAILYKTFKSNQKIVIRPLKN